MPHSRSERLLVLRMQRFALQVGRELVELLACKVRLRRKAESAGAWNRPNGRLAVNGFGVRRRCRLRVRGVARARQKRERHETGVSNHLLRSAFCSILSP